MLLIAWHSRTGASEQLAQAAAQSARREAGEGAVREVRADRVEPDLLLQAAGYLFVCPENLGSMSGVMKDMFDRCYYPLLGRVEGRAYATIVAAGSDGHGAEAQIDRIVTGWRLRRVAEPLIVNLSAQTPDAILAAKRVQAQDLDKAGQIGAAMATGLAMGMF